MKQKFEESFGSDEGSPSSPMSEDILGAQDPWKEITPFTHKSTDEDTVRLGSPSQVIQRIEGSTKSRFDRGKGKALESDSE